MNGDHELGIDLQLEHEQYNEKCGVFGVFDTPDAGAVAGSGRRYCAMVMRRPFRRSAMGK